MNFKWFACFFYLCFCLSVKATTFIETSIEDRMRQASGVLTIEYLGESYKKLPTGQVVTEATVKIIESTGIKSSEIINHNNFKIIIPGGMWQGRRYKVSGIPRFKEGEVATLIVKKSDFGFIMPNLAMSKFVKKSIDSKKYLVSPIFSEKKGIGMIKESEFKILTSQIFGKELAKINIDKYVSTTNEELGQKNIRRKPASKASETPKEESIPTIWFVLLLGALGFVPALLLKGKRNEG